MKRLALGLAAVASLSNAVAAADLSVKAPPMVAAPFTWTGFYGGVHGGFGWSTSQGLDAKGAFGGGQIGYNYQFGTFVIGLEGDVAGANISQTVNGITVFGVPFTSAFTNDTLASVRGRAGVAYNTMLFYGTAGGGWAHNKISANINGLTASSDAWQSGWTAGAGIEWSFAPNWTGKFEYLHYGLGNTNFFGTLPSGKIDIDTAKIGINYLFR